MVQRLLQPVLAASDAAKLVMGIRFFRINFDCSFESFSGFVELMPMLKNQAKLVMGLGIARVDRRIFHRTPKTLTLSQRESDIADIAAEHGVGVVKQEGREQVRRDNREEPGLNHKRQRSQADYADGSAKPDTKQGADGNRHQQGETQSAQTPKHERGPATESRFRHAEAG